MLDLPADAAAWGRLVNADTSVATVATPSAVADPKRWHALAVLLAALFMDLLDGNVVNVAIPRIQQDLHVTAAQIQWIPAAYMLSFGVLLIPGGRLGDIVGRKRMFLIGAAGLVIGSLLCTFAWSAEAIVAARVVQGAFAAMMVPQVLAIIRVAFAEEFGKVVAASAVVAGLAVVSGPLIGGLLVEADLPGLGWRAVFAINVPVGLLTILLAARWVRESRAPDVRRLDLAGFVLAVVGLLLLLVPLVQGREFGWPLWSVSSMALVLPIFAGFVLHQRSRIRRGLSPLVVLRLFQARGFSAGIVVNLLFQSLPAGLFLVWTLYVQSGLGWTPLQAGLATLPFSIAVAVSGGLSAQVVYPRLGRMTLVLGVGLTICGVAAFGIVARMYGEQITAGGMMLPFVLIGLGMGQVLSPVTGLIMSYAPVADAGSASGLVSATGQIGAALGVAFVGLVFFGSAGTGFIMAFELSMWSLAGLMAVVVALVFVLPRPAVTRPVDHPPSA